MTPQLSRIWHCTSVTLCFFALLTIGCEKKRPADPAREEWIRLFNGMDLQNWEVKIAGRELNDNFGDTFRVEDGVIKVAYDGYDRFDDDFGILIYNTPFSYYRLAVEYRFTGEQLSGGPGWALRNSGVMIHSQSAASMTRDQDFPISIEVQLLGGTGEGERTTANLCTPGTNVVMNDELITTHCINSTSETYHGDAWVRAEIEVLGDSSISHWIDGKEVLAYQQPQIGGGVVNQYDPALKMDGQLIGSGFIGLQSESHPIEFRKVELLELIGCTDPKAINFKNYFVQSDPSTCLY